MPNEPKQPDLFDWKPIPQKPSRFRKIIKSKTLFWLIFGAFFLPVLFFDLAILMRLIQQRIIPISAKSVLSFVSVHVFFFIIAAFKFPQSAKALIRSKYFQIGLPALVSLAVLHYFHGTNVIYNFLRNKWLLTIGLTILLLIYVIKSSPFWLLRILKSKVFLIFVIVSTLLLLLLAHEGIYKFIESNWFALLGILSVSLSIWAVIEIPKKIVNSLEGKKGDFDSEFDVEEKKIKLTDDLRKSTATIIGGLFLVIGAVFSYTNYTLSYEGQITDRYSKAVELLENEDTSVRLGGLYALERIALDSAKDHPTIMEILVSYLQEKTKKQKEIAANSNSNSNLPNSTIFRPVPATNEIPMTNDMIAAIEIIKRRNIQFDKNGFAFNLSNLNLAKLKLDNIDLTYDDFTQSNLSGTSMESANLQHANFYGAKLVSAKLGAANLSYAEFISTKLNRADLSETILIDAKFWDSDLNYTDLSSSNLTSANFDSCKLEYTVFYYANLSKTDFSNADLTKSMGLTFEQLSAAIIDESTKLPAELESKREELLELSKRNYFN